MTAPKVMTLAAAVEVTAILDNQEAVTGTFAGELIVWSLRHGKVRGAPLVVYSHNENIFNFSRIFPKMFQEFTVLLKIRNFPKILSRSLENVATVEKSN